MSSPSAFSIHKLSSRNLLQLLPYSLGPCLPSLLLHSPSHCDYSRRLYCRASSLLTRSRLPLKRRLIPLLSSILHRRHWRRLLSERERAELVAHILSSPSLLSFWSWSAAATIIARGHEREREDATAASLYVSPLQCLQAPGLPISSPLRQSARGGRTGLPFSKKHPDIKNTLH